MEFSFSTYDVKKFIESLDGRASEIDKRIKAIEAAADSFNVQVSSSCDRDIINGNYQKWESWEIGQNSPFFETPGSVW